MERLIVRVRWGVWRGGWRRRQSRSIGNGWDVGRSWRWVWGFGWVEGLNWSRGWSWTGRWHVCGFVFVAATALATALLGLVSECSYICFPVAKAMRISKRGFRCKSKQDKDCQTHHFRIVRSRNRFWLLFIVSAKYTLTHPHPLNQL
jgi:hypothetical protein